MKRRKSLWQPDNGWLCWLLIILLACNEGRESHAQKRLVKKAKKPVSQAPKYTVPLTVDKLNFNLPKMSLFVLPGQKTQIEAELGPAMTSLTAKTKTGKLDSISSGQWVHTAPDRPGQDMFTVTDSAGTMRTDIRMCIMIPSEMVKAGRLNNYRIGNYQLGIKNPIYAPPTGYFEVLGENTDDWLTEHVLMRDIVTKQTDKYPRYIVIQPKLLVKLEAVLAECKKAGIKVRRFSFISGYRTPYYNETIENVSLSRHQYGDAADVFIDYDRDGYMDDLNKDGKKDIKDAQVIVDIVNKMDKSKPHSHLAGGLGLYNAKGTRTPFVHIDTRGNMARWIN